MPNVIKDKIGIKIFNYLTYSNLNDKIRKGNGAVGYSRSSKETRYSKFNIENQKKSIQELAKEKNLNLITIFDEGIKRGAKNKRPKFDEMIKYVIANKSITTIIVSSLDRLTREGDKIVDTLLTNGINLISKRENSSLDNEDGIFITRKWLIEAYLEHLRKSATISVSRKHVLRKGIKTAIPPFGYIIKRCPKSGQSKVIIDKVKGRKIKKTFELYAKGYKLVEIMKKLNYGPNDIQRRQVSNLMRDPFYIGLIVDKAIPIPIKGNHTPLIPIDLFEKCLTRNIKNKKNKK